MIALNKVMLIGNLTRDPEMRYIPSGQGVTNFSIATNRRWKTQDGQIQEDTQYHDIVVWGKLAELISQILKKGNKVYVDGRLQTRSWEAPDGAKMRRTEIVLENFVPLTPRPAGEFSDFSKPNPVTTAYSPSTPKPSPKPDTGSADVDNSTAILDDEINLDEIPF